MKLRATPFPAHAVSASLHRALKPLTTSAQPPRTEAQIRTGRSNLSLFQGGDSSSSPASKPGRTEAEIRQGRSDLSLFSSSSQRPSAPVAGDGFAHVDDGAALKPGSQTSVAAPATRPGEEADGLDFGKAAGSVAQMLLDSVAAPFKFLGGLFGF